MMKKMKVQILSIKIYVKHQLMIMNSRKSLSLMMDLQLISQQTIQLPNILQIILFTIERAKFVEILEILRINDSSKTRKFLRIERTLKEIFKGNIPFMF